MLIPGIVFQCVNCLCIIGDSGSWVAACSFLNAFTISEIVTSNIETLKKLVTVPLDNIPADDAGSTYCEINCKCGAELGRMYQSTSRGLDHIRGAYTIYTKAVKSYQLGGNSIEPVNDEVLKVVRPSPSEVGKRLAALEAVVTALAGESD